MNTSIKILIGLAVLAVVGEGIYIGKLIQSVNEKQKNIVVLEEAAKAGPRLVVDTQKFKNESTIKYQGDFVSITQNIGDDEPTVEVLNRSRNKPLDILKDGYISQSSIALNPKDVPTVANELVSLLLGNVSPVFSCTSTAPVVPR